MGGNTDQFLLVPGKLVPCLMAMIQWPQIFNQVAITGVYVALAVYMLSGYVLVYSVLVN